MFDADADRKKRVSSHLRADSLITVYGKIGMVLHYASALINNADDTRHTLAPHVNIIDIIDTDTLFCPRRIVNQLWSMQENPHHFIIRQLANSQFLY